MCYRLLITRLQNYMGSDLDQFKKAAQLERILLRHSFSTSNECVTLPVATWQSLCWQWSTSIVHVSSKKNTLSQACTLQVSGNGSWMFNTVSVALVGGESKATELRLLCAIELLLHTQEYTDTYPFADVCCIKETSENCVNDSYSSAFTLAALTTVIQHLYWMQIMSEVDFGWLDKTDQT